MIGDHDIFRVVVVNTGVRRGGTTSGDGAHRLILGYVALNKCLPSGEGTRSDPRDVAAGDDAALVRVVARIATGSGGFGHAAMIPFTRR